MRAAARGRGRARRARRTPTGARDRRRRRPRTRGAAPRRRRGAPGSPETAKPRRVLHPAAALGLYLERIEAAVVTDPGTPHGHAAPLELRPRADVRAQRSHDANELALRAGRDRAGGRPGRSSPRRSARPPAAGRSARGRRAPHRGGARRPRPRGRTRHRRRPPARSGTPPAVAIGPASSASTVSWIVTPVSPSPAMIARSTGAAPRHRGSSDGWTLSHVRSVRSAGGIRSPYAQTTTVGAPSSSPAPGRSGWRTGIPSRSATSFAGGAASRRPRPAGASGRVRSAAISWRSASRSSTSAPNGAVAATAMRAT